MSIKPGDTEIGGLVVEVQTTHLTVLFGDKLEYAVAGFVVNRKEPWIFMTGGRRQLEDVLFLYESGDPRSM
jgi:hypothetical protein